MPKLINRTPKYRRHRATGQAVVTLGGKDRYLGKWQSAESKKEYARLITRWVATGGVLAPNSAASVTVAELVAAFWTHCKSYYVDADGNANNEQGNFRTLIKPFREMYGKTLAAEFGPLKLKALRQTLVALGLPRGNVNHHVNRIRLIFKWGAEHEMVSASVDEALKCGAGLR